MIYRIVDLKVLANSKTILGVENGRAFSENLFTTDKFVIATKRNVELIHLAKKHGRNREQASLLAMGLNCPSKLTALNAAQQGLLEHFNLKETTMLLKEMGE